MCLSPAKSNIEGKQAWKAGKTRPTWKCKLRRSESEIRAMGRRGISERIAVCNAAKTELSLHCEAETSQGVIHHLDYHDGYDSLATSGNWNSAGR